MQFTVLAVAYDCFHKELLSGSQDSTIRAWDVTSGQLLRKQTGHAGWVTDLLFVPELRLLFSCSVDHTICVWNDKGKQVQVLRLATVLLCMSATLCLHTNSVHTSH